MSLTICVLCGHPAHEHSDDGCLDLVFPDIGYVPTSCVCQRTEAEVYEQAVPAVGDDDAE